MQRARQELPVKDPVLTKLQAGGFEMTALHNHVFHESPRVMYMHIHAMGDAVKIDPAPATSFPPLFNKTNCWEGLKPVTHLN